VVAFRSCPEGQEEEGCHPRIQARRAVSLRRAIHRSAWNKNSANFAFWAFSEVHFKGILRSSR
jgi:hypothetical protein